MFGARGVGASGALPGLTDSDHDLAAPAGEFMPMLAPNYIEPGRDGGFFTFKLRCSHSHKISPLR
jgi:hypothetical protein